MGLIAHIRFNDGLQYVDDDKYSEYSCGKGLTTLITDVRTHSSKYMTMSIHVLMWTKDSPNLLEM
jgi:hypothetical protein